jgi:hypothetical protein
MDVGAVPLAAFHIDLDLVKLAGQLECLSGDKEKIVSGESHLPLECGGIDQQKSNSNRVTLTGLKEQMVGKAMSRPEGSVLPAGSGSADDLHSPLRGAEGSPTNYLLSPVRCDMLQDSQAFDILSPEIIRPPGKNSSTIPTGKNLVHDQVGAYLLDANKWPTLGLRNNC